MLKQLYRAFFHKNSKKEKRDFDILKTPKRKISVQPSGRVCRRSHLTGESLSIM